MRIRKSRKALSPVVASIILIAVTVAVSIAVAAWMGALTFNFMGSSSLTITNVTWNGNTGDAANSIDLAVKNTGTKLVTVAQIKVNNSPCGNFTGNPTVSIAANNVTTITINNIGWSNGNNYKIDLFDASGQGVGSTQQYAPGV
jgi:flagellin-like protein